MKKTNILFTASVFIFCLVQAGISLAQTGAAGVGNSSNNVIWLDANRWLSYSNSGSNLLMSAHYSPTIKHASFTEPGGAFTFTSTHILPASISQRSQGSLMATTGGVYTVPTGHNKVTLGNVPFTTWQNCTLNGYIAEVVIYNSALNNLERILIENYLGAKYNMTIPTDLYAYQATHNIGLIALGNNGVNSQTTAKVQV
ncbi:MAG: hypothetical protein IPO32_05415 [Crocinitomicaceae bacterium]|nr:hypothetical protein [Crocinitomicaceae bacterium]